MSAELGRSEDEGDRGRAPRRDVRMQAYAFDVVPRTAARVWFARSPELHACRRARGEDDIAADDLMRARVLRVEVDALHRAQRAAHGRGWA